jgi:putative FmdB family regulatory protein
MPIYEYRCAACGERFDRLTSQADRAQVRCPRCEGRRVERLLSTFAVGKSQSVAPAPGPCGSSDCACRAQDA